MRTHTLHAASVFLGPRIDEVCELEVESVAVPGIAEGDAVDVRSESGEVDSFVVVAPPAWTDAAFTQLRVMMGPVPELDA